MAQLKREARRGEIHDGPIMNPDEIEAAEIKRQEAEIAAQIAEYKADEANWEGIHLIKSPGTAVDGAKNILKAYDVMWELGKKQYLSNLAKTAQWKDRLRLQQALVQDQRQLDSLTMAAVAGLDKTGQMGE